MEECLLSILVCTMPSRQALFRSLWSELERQCQELDPALQNQVQLLNDPEMGYSVGRKRQLLLERAQGHMIVFIDDDDTVAANYIYAILMAIRENPDLDCIGIQGWITTHGIDPKPWRISKDYHSWYELNGVYYRTPNHISPVRRTIALQAGFPDKGFSEDYDYSMRILPFLQREVKIEIDLYHYRFGHK